MSDALTWAEFNPKLRVEPSPNPPLILMEAWNELLEGSYILPTNGDGTAYGDAIANILTLPAARRRTSLNIDETGAASTPRLASVSFKDAAANPIPGATLPVFATAMRGPGFYGQYSLSEVVPAGAVAAIVGYRVNTETVSTGSSDFALYSMSYKEPDGSERVMNSDFSAGLAGWSLWGQGGLVVSDRGPGSMLLVQATPMQISGLNSISFPVTPGSTFTFSISARVAPESLGSGYFCVIWLGSNSLDFSRVPIPLKAVRSFIGSGVTDAIGNFAFDLSPLGTVPADVEVDFDGDPTFWPNYAHVTGK